jgi:predicted nucleotidyltransferase component of viral defense system
MQTSERELMREANDTGFRPEMMEKVWHLMAILDGISIHPFLKDRLVLKGGTALNLFFFDLPRLSVDIDLNYMFRMPLFGIRKKSSHSIGTRRTKEIPLLDIHELGAGKLSALFGRHASRDLFDAHQLLTKCSLDIEQLRFACLVYGAMGSKDWREISIDEIHFQEKELKDQLIPVLRKRVFRNGYEILALC